jgi:hypothetical protein
MKRASFLETVIVVTLALGARPASAQTPDDEHRSVSLFEEARRMVDAGNCPGAIPSLRESLHLHPSIGAHLSLAQCLATDEPATAWRELKLAERLAVEKGDARAAYARTKASSLEPRLSLIHIRTVPDAHDLEVRIDFAAAEIWDGVASVSPGDHTIEVRTHAKKWSSRSVQTRTGTTVEVTFPLEDESTAPKPRATDDGGASRRRIGLRSARSQARSRSAGKATSKTSAPVRDPVRTHPSPAPAAEARFHRPPRAR